MNNLVSLLKCDSIRYQLPMAYIYMTEIISIFSFINANMTSSLIEFHIYA